MSSLTPENWLLEFLFPTRLHRLAYFLRATVTNCGTVVLYVYSEQIPNRYMIAAFVVLALYQIVYIVRPRLRDIGMSLWWLLALFIPVVNAVLALILLFRAPRYDLEVEAVA